VQKTLKPAKDSPKKYIGNSNETMGGRYVAPTLSFGCWNLEFLKEKKKEIKN